MDTADEIAHRVVPFAGSELPLSPHARAVLVGHAATLIRDALRAEREACAKIADGTLMEVYSPGEERVAKSIADEIRNRINLST